MPRRIFNFALLFFEFLWLVVVIPAHTRGMITMGPADSSGCCCCHKLKPHEPTPADQKNCAICNFAAHLTLPPVINYRPVALGLVEILPFNHPIFLPSFATPIPYHGRAPPRFG